MVHLNGVRKSWGVYLLIALIDDDPAKSLPRCTTRKVRVNMSYVLQQRVSDVNQDAALVVYFNVPPLECCKCISSKVPRSYCPSNNNNNNFLCANILENQAQWRDKTKGLSNCVNVEQCVSR